MYLLLLIIIYLAFISLGLPDSLLGVSWPLAYSSFQVPYEAAGYVAMTITMATTISALFADKMNRRFGPGKVIFLSGSLTALSLLGFSISGSLAFTLLMAIPLGLGGGSVDATLNNYVAQHYKAHHMNWLHSFWGLGATFGPIIMAQVILVGYGWRGGYVAVAGLQGFLVLILLAAIPLWKLVDQKRAKETLHETLDHEVKERGFGVIKLKGVLFALAVFVFYCGLEAGMGLWGSSYLIDQKSFDPVGAARLVSLYYGGITIGRVLSGFIAIYVHNKVMIRGGTILTLLGVMSLVLPGPSQVTLVSFLLIGLGLSPIFPAMIHGTPENFGKGHSGQIIGFQMASASLGMTVLPPLLGLITVRISMVLFPYILLIFGIIILIATERVGRLKRN